MWQDEMTTMLRYLINDVGSESYTDTRLQKSILVGAKYVNNDLFNNQYSISLAGSGTITPDPSVNNDISFVNLSVLKAACLISTGEAKLAAGQGIAIKDGSSSLDLKGVASSKKVIMDSYCKAYEDAKFEYETGVGSNSNPAGEAVFGPIKYWMNYERRVL